MKSLQEYISENVKDKLTHFIHKALLPDTTVKTEEYLHDIFSVIDDKTKFNSAWICNAKRHNIKNLIEYNNLVKWEYVKDNKSFIHPKTDNWDVSNIEDDDYVIPFGDGAERIDSGDKFTILPFVINKKSLYSTGAAYRDGKIIKSKEDIYKYIIKPAEDVI